MIRPDILVLAPTPTHPQDFGNRKRIYEVCQRLKERQARIHYLYYPGEFDWRAAMPMDAYQAMSRCWDSFHLIAPTRSLHSDSIGSDHLIDEWWDPGIGDYLAWLFSVKRFDAFIVNYTWLSKALEYAPKETCKILDTHDRFSERRGLLESHGLAKEYFHTTSEQEAIGLDRADLVWAIKDDEKRFFQTISSRPVVTMLHADPDRPIARKQARGDEGFLVAGFIGARNNINCSNARQFVSEAMPIFRKYLAPIKLRLAGSMCQDLADLATISGVELMGRVDDVDDFYSAIDVALIPMSFSTGLKIKAAEALSVNAAIVSHAHAFEGFPAAHPYHQQESFAQMAEACVELSFAPELLDELRAASATVQSNVRQAVSSAMDETWKYVRNRSARMVVVLPPEALQEQTTIAAHVEQATGYLKHNVGLVFYCNFDLDAKQARRLSERYGNLGPILIGTGCKSPSGFEFGRSSFSDISLAYSLLAYWLFALPGNIGELPEEGARVPAYLRVDILEQLRGPSRRTDLVASLRPFQTVHLVGSHDSQLARLAGTVGAASQIGVPYWFSQPPRMFNHWREGSSDSMRRILLLANTPNDALTSAILDLVAVHSAGRAMEVLVVHIGESNPPAAMWNTCNSLHVRWTRAHEVVTDMSCAGGRPGLAISLNPESPQFAFLIETAIRSGIPTMQLDKKERSDEDDIGRTGVYGFARNLGDALDALREGREVTTPATGAGDYRFGHDAGWAHIWRMLNERRQIWSVWTS